MPIRERTSSRSVSGSVMSMPSTRILPEVGSSSRLTQRSRVDLPDPDGPMTQTTWPWSTWKSMPLSTSLSPKYLCRSRTSMAGPGRALVLVTGSPRSLGASFEPRHEPGERERDDQVETAAAIAAGWSSRSRTTAVAGERGQLAVAGGHADDEQQRGVLDQDARTRWSAAGSRSGTPAAGRPRPSSRPPLMPSDRAASAWPLGPPGCRPGSSRPCRPPRPRSGRRGRRRRCRPGAATSNAIGTAKAEGEDHQQRGQAAEELDVGGRQPAVRARPGRASSAPAPAPRTSPPTKAMTV